jgi:MFS family permease
LAEAGADRGEPAAASPGASTLAALRDPRFGPYFAGSVLSNCGTWFQTLGQSLLVYRLTHSAFLLGVVNFSQFAAVFVLAPWSGGAADRFDRRRLLLVTQLAAVAVTGLLAAIVATGHASAAIVIGLVLLLGATTAFSSPTAQALVPSLVPRELLPSAIALNSVTFNLARAVGPSLGALVIGTLGIAAALAVNCLSYLALIGALLVIRPLSAPRSRPGSTGLGDSLRLVRRDHRLAAQLGLVAVIGMSTDPVATLSPAFASRELHVPDTWAGFLVGAFGAGAVLAAFTIATRRARSPGRLVVTLAMLGGGIGAYGLAPSLPIALAVLVVAGAGYLSSNTHVTTNLQLRVDDAQRGRIMALWSICFLGSRPIASLVDGALASSAGVRAAVVALALPAAVSALLVASAARRPAA